MQTTTQTASEREHEMRKAELRTLHASYMSTETTYQAEGACTTEAWAVVDSWRSELA